MNKTKSVDKPSGIPAEFAGLLGSPALERGESRSDYDALLVAIAKSVGANDIVGWLQADDVAYHTWDARRLKHIRQKMLLESQIEVVENLLKTTYDDQENYPGSIYAIFDAKNDARKWATDAPFGKTLDAKLAGRGYDHATIQARAYAKVAVQLTAIDKSIADRELRRMVTLNEIARRDATMARLLEKASNDVLEAEFSEVEK